MKQFLHNSLRSLFLSLAVLLAMPVLAQKINLKELKLIDNVRELSINEGLGDITAPAHVKHVVNNKAMKSPTRAGNTNPYEAMAGEWEMTTASGEKWNVTVHAAAENDPDYNKVLYVTGMMGYDWTVLTMSYSYNIEEGKPEVYIKAGELFAEGVNFSGVGVCDIYLYKLVGNSLSTQDFAATVSADGKTIDFGESTFCGALFSGGTFTGYAWFRETGVKMTRSSVNHNINHNGVCYSLNEETMQATVISGGEYSGEIVIPESVNYNGTTYSVTSIGHNAFYECSGLTSVTIPNSVASIGENAFTYCSGLTSVTIGNSVTSIGYAAFADCSGLTSVTIPNSVTIIGGYAFYECTGLTSVTIGSGVTSIGYWAFAFCSGLTSVTIPNSVTSIGESAFMSCYGLTSVTIPNSVTSISDYAFSYCSGLTEMKVDANNPKYDSRENCNAIIETSSNTLISGCQTTVIPNSVTSIGQKAFYGCSGLTSVTIPNSVKSIGDGAFMSCYGLTSVTIPNSVTSIGGWGFADCSGLTSVTIPNSVKSIGESAFSSCDYLTTIKVDENNPIYDSRDNCNAIIETASNTLIQGCKTTRIPNSVTSIWDYAFSYCSGLTSVTIGNSVTSIGYAAFADCTGLTSVTIGSGVKSIGKWAFRYCSDLLDVYCYAEKVPSTESDAFEGSYAENATLHVPAASIDSYKATEPWSDFGKIVALTPEETGIDELKGENGKVKTALYDLSGRRVQKAQKGVFIQNGKVMVR